MDEEIEIAKGRLAAMEAGLRAIASALAPEQAARAAAFLAQHRQASTSSALANPVTEMASPLSALARAAFEQESAGLLALLQGQAR